MKAAVVTAFGAAPHYLDFRDPVADADHSVVRVLAAAVHNVVRSRAAGRHYSSTDALPFVAGIDAIARTADGGRIYTGGCPEPFGTLAELAPVPTGWGVPVPDGVDDVTAAAIVNPGQSSWVPLQRLLADRPGSTVLVHGATGVSGLLAVQIAQVLGAGRVVAAGRSAAGLEAATARGADAVVTLADETNDPTDDLAAALVGAAPDGVDIVIDYLWGARTAALVPALLRSGRDPEQPLDLVEVGSMAGPDLTVDAAWLRSRPLRMSGSGLGSVGPRAMFAAVAGVLGAAAAGRLTVDAAAHPLAEVARVWSSTDRLVLIP